MDTGQPHFDEQGRFLGYVGTSTDVHEQRLAEIAVRQAETRFRTMADNSPVLIWETDGGGAAFVNRHYLDFFGRPLEAVVGMGWADFLHPDDGGYVTAYQSAFARRERYEYPARFRRHDGEYRWLQNVGTPHFGPDGTFIGFIGCSFDITDTKRAEEALVESDRRKDEFLATLAHELRNPLAPIRNALQVMKLAGNDAGAVETARSMLERQLEQMVRLVDDLMDVSRITRGKVALRKERVRLAAVVGSAVEASRPLIDQMGHKLTLTQPKYPIVVDADPTRLAQVFTNLLNNAAKYSDRGGHIRLTTERQGSDVVVSVRDTGIGIPAANLASIFDMFSQVDRSLERSQGGLGIGLCLVKRLVEMHGGRIEARSDGPGRGSEFLVRLSVVVKASVPPTEGRDAPAAPKSSLHILIVDDNKDGADSLSMMLKIMGNETHTAYDGQEGVEAAERYRPDVILFDIGLPKLNGYEACRRIREQPWGKSMVLIAVTGWGQDEDRRRSHDAGFDHHMVKPVDPTSLMKLLAELNTVMQ
jgi:two-component system CheB/CheR fusion protein